MKKSVLNRTLLICFTIICTFFTFTTHIYAFSISDIFTGADDFIQSGIDDQNVTIEDADLKDMSDLLYNTLLILAIVIAVIVGMVIGIQFMTGSVAQKAKVKETLIPYIAGCIVIFGAFGIWKLVVTIMSNV